MAELEQVGNALLLLVYTEVSRDIKSNLLIIMQSIKLTNRFRSGEFNKIRAFFRFEGLGAVSEASVDVREGASC